VSQRGEWKLAGFGMSVPCSAGEVPCPYFARRPGALRGCCSRTFHAHTRPHPSQSDADVAPCCSVPMELFRSLLAVMQVTEASFFSFRRNQTYATPHQSSQDPGIARWHHARQMCFRWAA